MFINRDWNITEEDDFILNIKPRLNSTNEAMPIYYENKLMGWKIQSRFE